jgi:hypothetical protein
MSEVQAVRPASLHEQIAHAAGSMAAQRQATRLDGSQASDGLFTSCCVN